MVPCNKYILSQVEKLKVVYVIVYHIIIFLTSFSVKSVLNSILLDIMNLLRQSVILVLLVVFFYFVLLVHNSLGERVGSLKDLKRKRIESKLYTCR